MPVIWIIQFKSRSDGYYSKLNQLKHKHKKFKHILIINNSVSGDQENIVPIYFNVPLKRTKHWWPKKWWFDVLSPVSPHLCSFSPACTVYRCKTVAACKLGIANKTSKIYENFDWKKILLTLTIYIAHIKAIISSFYHEFQNCAKITLLYNKLVFQLRSFDILISIFRSSKAFLRRHFLPLQFLLSW